MDGNFLRCPLCNKVFKKISALQNHKNRKKKCYVKDIPEDQIANPNRCGHCNNSFSTKWSLQKHLKICKIRVNQDNVAGQTNNNLAEEVAQLRQIVNDLQAAQTNQLATTTAANNITINNSVNIRNDIHFHNYLTPKMDTLNISAEELTASGNVVIFITKMIFFNKDIPENHVLYRPNVKDDRLIVRDEGEWQIKTGDNIEIFLNSLKRNTFDLGMDKIASGFIGKHAELFNALPKATQGAVIRYNDTNPSHTSNSTLMDLISTHRDMVKTTMDLNKPV